MACTVYFPFSFVILNLISRHISAALSSVLCLSSEAHVYRKMSTATQYTRRVLFTSSMCDDSGSTRFFTAIELCQRLIGTVLSLSQGDGLRPVVSVYTYVRLLHKLKRTAPKKKAFHLKGLSTAPKRVSLHSKIA